MIFTFYSYKGGVGRSMALANVGVMLAQRGHQVIACDWDLEAPGLGSYFASDSQPLRELRERPGIIDLILEYKAVMAGTDVSLPDDAEVCAQIGDMRVRRPLDRLVEVFRPSSGDGILRLLTAGCRTDESERRYVNEVQRFDWSDFYENWAGNSYIEFLRRDLDGEADFVLVDSRTGITEQGGVCSHHLADVVVLMTGANDQHLAGSRWMAETLRHPTLTQQRGDRSLRVLPVASRLEITAEEEGLAEFREQFREKFQQIVPSELGAPDRFLRDTEIPYIPAYSFRERLVALEADRRRSRELHEAYVRLTDTIVDLAHRAGGLPARVLLCYAHQDRDWCDRLRAHLGQLTHSGELRAFHDRDVQASSDGTGELETSLRSSEVIVLLISPQFLASRWCTKEIVGAVRDSSLSGGRVVPVIIDYCNWSAFEFGKYQAMPRDGSKEVRPLVTWPNSNLALAEIAREIQLILKRRDKSLVEPLDRSRLPHAFLSYTLFDDRHDGGAISELCRRLASAVRAVTGLPFEIFQDVGGIGVGEHWRSKLDEMLNEARFFIPILTPSYFTSKPCREELEKFLRAEAERGRNDLVLPIYYIECDVLEDDDLRAADPLASMLHERQRQDWRELRFEPFGTKDVRRALELLAREIVKARRRPMLPPSTREPAPLIPGTVFRDIDAPWCPELVVIPPGEFMMGSTEVQRQWAVRKGARQEWVEHEQPQHLVHIAYPFAVGRHPITFEEYGHFARTTGRAQPGDEGWGRVRRPVINVDWEDSKAYVEWLAAETGQPYRLLSEAEWEYACRAGTTTRYWWGDGITAKNANYERNVGRTSEVGSYPVNPFGLYDTHGNVWEWVEDRWHDSYNGAPDDGSAWIAGSDSRLVLRGGSWVDAPWHVRSANRGRVSPGSRKDTGFRVARTLTS
jgi:formylglycine-generating enzyme required for sulfatase activity